MIDNNAETYGVYEISDSVHCSIETVNDSSVIFDEDFSGDAVPIPGTDYKYVPFGPDNHIPYSLMDAIGKDEILAQNQYFNVLTCYGSGLKYFDCETKEPTRDPEIRRFFNRNFLPSLWIEQITDLKWFYYSVAVIILSRDYSKIVQLRHKEACHCRFEKADDNGKINHVFYADFRKGAPAKEDIEVIPLLDFIDPLGDLLVRMGKEPGKDGQRRVRTNELKFAIVSRFPTPGLQYYPVPYYTSIFKGHWYDIKQLIGLGKKAKLKNSTSVKYIVEVHDNYWKNICVNEGISDPLKKAERIKKEKENIVNFVTGIENSGKVWISGYYINPDGKEISMVRINVVDKGKEGGDWAEDIAEANNVMCYAFNIHPNLVGATPGKSQTNNSGSDKRELFTLKQSLEVAPHDLLCNVHNVVIEYNGWSEKVYPDVPLIMLTTLDKKNDAMKISIKDGTKKDPNDE